MKYLRTSDLAKAVGVHPNTVRRYVDRGILPPVEHSPSGYRRFTQRHLDCLRLARQVYGAQEISRLRVIRMLSRAGYSISAILRMLIQLDQGEKNDLRHALDTPRPDEDAYLASDRWISTLTDHEQRARTIIALIEEIIQKQTTENC